MENPIDTSPKQDETARKTIVPRQAAPAVSRSGGAAKPVVIGLALVAFVLGGLLGAFIMRQRYKSNQIVAVVNNVKITKDQFYGKLEETGGSAVIKQMVDRELKRQFAVKAGVAPTADDVNRRYDEMIKDPKLKEAVSKGQLKEKELKDNIRNVLIEASPITKGVTVTDEEIKRIYDWGANPKNLKSQYYVPDTVQIAIIVTSTKAESEKALADLKRGIAWAEVVKMYSKDRSRGTAGVLPPIQRGRNPSSKIPGLEDTVFGIKIGDQIGPVKISGFYWIIRSLDKKNAMTKPFDQVREECKTAALLQKGLPINGPRVQKEYQQFAKDAKIQAFWERYKDDLKLN